MSDISALGAAGTLPTASATTGSAAGTGATSQSTSSGLSSNEISQLADPQLFLKLLIAELQNQDPTNPMDPSTILSQTSELSQMEAVENMTSSITSEQTATEDTQATGLLGRSVTASVAGKTVTGTVSDVQLSASGAPVLTVGGTAVPLADVTDVSVPGSTVSSGSGASPTGGTTGS